MKRLLLLVLAITVFGIVNSNAQTSYTAAVGLGLDFGDGATLVGPSGKYFFTEEHVGQGEVLFGNGVTFIQIMYEYHGEFSEADGLRWYVGAGPSFGFASGDSAIGLRPLVGLDFKIANAPLAFSFDWRPAIFFEDGSSFEAARFGLGIRYAFE
ncbi:MAG TPA: hypothetical protein VKN36_08965 [Eudoraea sp.]|nr:hypothetical protein [Eudoraea sp.]